MRYLLATLIGLTLSASIIAQTNGEVETFADGSILTFRSGLWYGANGQAWTRSWQYKPQTYTYAYGQAYPVPRVGYWLYQRVATKTVTRTVKRVASTPKLNDTNPEDLALLEIAKARDKVEGELRAADLRHQTFLEKVNALGLKGNFAWPNYGSYFVAPRGAAKYGYGVGSADYGSTGDTGYAYSLQTVRSQYGELNLNTAFQQASRHVERAQELAGSGATDFKALVSAAGADAGRVATVLAEAQAAAIKLNAARPTSSRSVTTTVTGSGRTAAAGRESVPPMPPAEDKLVPANGGAETFLKEVGRPRCATCHSGANPKGGFLIDNYPRMTQEQQDKVLTRLLEDDPKAKMMPLDKDGKSVPLPVGELRRFAQVR